ncbi:MAG TPA: putative baseplate assembly protein, partial [Blastocatellia bacterium]|nr:putative baseplate assembly protein [Blastocatellia bacterium]
MPVLPPALDDRSFDDLVDELLARIPAHTPEWTNPQMGDPGRTLIELFAWLGDTILYRANLIPERQRLAFLRLLGEQMRPAIPARGTVSVFPDDENATSAVYLRPGATVKGPVNFETLSELTVLPVTAQFYYKRPITDAERRDLADVIDGLRSVYDLNKPASPYVTTSVFSGGKADTDGFDLIEQSIDKCLWIALLASKKELVDAVRDALGKNEFGAQQLLNIGIVPS